jgi:hypothetical protein
MTVLSVGQLQGLPPTNEITIASNTSLKIQGILRVSSIENSSGLEILSSTSAGAVTFARNLTTTSTISSNIISPSRFVVPIWTTSTRPSNPSIATLGYNSQTGSLENYTGTTWKSISNSFTN